MAGLRAARAGHVTSLEADGVASLALHPGLPHRRHQLTAAVMSTGDLSRRHNDQADLDEVDAALLRRVRTGGTGTCLADGAPCRRP